MDPGKRSANSSCTCKKVHYVDNKTDIEDNFIEGDNYSGISEISKSSVKYSGDVHSEFSLTTSILDGDNVDVRQKLENYENKIEYLENENQRINDSLLNEKKKTSNLEKKLQFVKDNQEVFMRLKEAYINMKYNEAAGRKMIEIRERGMQTWEGTICSTCVETEELRRQIDIMIQKYSELFVVSPGEMEHLTNTVKYLKDLINRREESWTFCINRDQKLQGIITMLENENEKLREIIANGRNEDITEEIIEDVKLEQQLLEERKIDEMQKFIEGITKELDKLKKIIIKYEKQYREIKEQHPGKYISLLNDKEMKIVQQIITKHTVKAQKKVTSEMRDSRSPSLVSERVPQSHRPASPLRSVTNRDASILRMNSSCKRLEKLTESAMSRIDNLYD